MQQAYLIGKPPFNFAVNGWPILPLHGKIPAIAGGRGFHDATTESHVIGQWVQHYPRCNWGIRTGGISGLVVLDVDPRNGGMETLHDLLKEYGTLPDTFTIKTGGGGYHYYFQHPGKRIPSKANALGPGLDIKADGGYVVAPGSIHPETCVKYETMVKCTPAELPDWVVKKIALIQEKRSKILLKDVSIIPEGTRNQTLTSRAGIMHRRNFSSEAIRVALKEENRKRCDPMLDESEIHGIVNSILRYSPSENNYSQNDLGNAQRVAARHGDTLRHCSKLGGWFVWNGCNWERDNTKAVRRKIWDVSQRMKEEAEACADQKTREALSAWAYKSERDSIIKCTIRQLEAMPDIAVQEDAFDSNPWLFNLSNGILNLKTGRFAPHNPQAMLTQISSVEYDSNAQCPTWHNFLETVLGGSSELMEYLQEAVGYSLTGDTRERAIFLLYGSGKNGKSTFLEILMNLLGDYASKVPFASFMQQKHNQIPNDIARLRCTRFAYASESQPNQQLNSTMLKELTGRETLTARFLYSEHFEFVPQFKLWFATNNQPEVADHTDSIWDRLKLIPFTVRINENQEDRNLPQKLRGELPGILNWALEGCRKWQAKGRLEDPAVIQRATRQYRMDNDPVEGFLEDCCQFDNPAAMTTCSAVWEAYQSWVEHSDINHPASQKTLGIRLKEKGCQPHRTRIDGSVQRCWKGISLIGV
jgi:putative DNA primase/helicase